MSDDSKLTAAMKRVDELTESPGARAQKVLIALRARPDISTWDVLCFCAEYLGMMLPAYPWLDKEAREVARMVYLAHYVHFSGPQDEKTIAEALG